MAAVHLVMERTFFYTDEVYVPLDGDRLDHAENPQICNHPQKLFLDRDAAQAYADKLNVRQYAGMQPSDFALSPEEITPFSEPDGFNTQYNEDTELMPESDPRSEVVSIDPERAWGTPCIAGTRVPIKSLFAHLASGVGLEEFLDDFEGVPREKCVKALELALEYLMQGLPDGRQAR